jgi:hypothetical protein
MPFPFGNDPAKIDRYRAFWSRAEVRRPLVGFSLVGWFPLSEFAAARVWGTDRYLTPDMIDPDAFIPDHLRMMREGEVLDDDVIRGACPSQVAIPFLPGILGCKMRVLPANVLGEERHLDWDQALAAHIDCENPWYRKYMEYADALVRASGGSFPVSHAAEIGPTDIHASLRGHTESIVDLADEPEKSRELLWLSARMFRDLTEAVWKRLPLYHGGYFDAQYSIWAPGPIVRMQEDASAVYSPSLYRRFVQPVDRMLGGHFASSFIHLHSTSMFLLEAILEITEIQCYEVNNDALGPPVHKMVKYFRRIQEANRPLVIRGSFTPDELKLLMDSLSPRGLMLNVMLERQEQMDPLRPIVGM